MAYTTPPTYTVGSILNAANLNTYLRDNVRYLKGQDGPIALNDILSIYVSSTAANATAALYLGDSAGTVRAGVWGQRNGSNAGGRLIGLTLNDAGTLTEGWRLDQLQRMGIGTDSPLFRLHVRDASTGGNIGHWTSATIAGSAQTILPTSTGATAVGLFGMVVPTTGPLAPQMVATNGMITSPANTQAVFTNGSVTDQVTATLTSGGVTIIRNAGSLTYRAALLVFWF
ncbi:MAG TPA: hypothetical protein VFS21_33285 [Roseiflexaceae bacterium]|nr:hypothetical protein [Roseiflexaceae bacterium]